jgi:hypothetical protein
MHPSYKIQPPIGGVASSQPTLPPPIGGAPRYPIAPPMGSTSMAQYVPPVGVAPMTELPNNPYKAPVTTGQLAPIGGVEACPLIAPPMGGEIGVTMIPSYPLTPAIGSYAGTNPMNLLTPSRGSTPSTIVAQTAIIPPVGGPSNHQGYLATDY